VERFHVVFARRENFRVGFGRKLDRKGHKESVDENLELAYAISVHKAQGSDFQRVYVVVPKIKQALLSTELFYTALTRGRRHCTLLVEQDISPLVQMRRPENARLGKINSSLFTFRPVPDDLLPLQAWRVDERRHRTLGQIMVRSKSEVIIANMLHERDIPFSYEEPLYASDGSFYLPDFTVNWRGTDYYWEHLGMLDRDDYRAHWEKKRAWYDRYFPGRLIITEESGELSRHADAIIRNHFI
jgi:exodeoxyribonuclease V alpha subunit